MNNIIKIDNKDIQVIDSREVARMMGKKHGDVLEYIEGKYNNKDGSVRIVGILPTLENGGFDSSKYFIPSTYKAGTKEYKCYLVTELGCALLGNKMKGEKGILFSAKYVERFNHYEEQLKELTQPKLPQTYKEALYALIEAEEEKERLM